MVIKLNIDCIQSILKHFECELEEIHMARIIVNQDKEAILLSNVPVGELFNSEKNKKTGAKSLVVEIDQESVIERE